LLLFGGILLLSGGVLLPNLVLKPTAESRFTQRQEWRPLDAGNVCSVRFCWQRWGHALLRYPKRALGKQK